MSHAMACPHTRMVEKMSNDLYFGDTRKEGLTVRVEVLEKSFNALNRQLRAMDAKFWAIILMLLGVAVEVAKK